MATPTTTNTTSTKTSGTKGKSSFMEHIAPKDHPLLFDKENYIWMIGGIALIFIGFLLMAGGKSPDPHKFNYDEIYSFRRITLAPIVILTGFVVEVFAIMKKPKDA